MVSLLPKTYAGSEHLNPKVEGTSGSFDYKDSISRLKMIQGFARYISKMKTSYQNAKIKIPLGEKGRRGISNQVLCHLFIWESANV
jgi:hypothetical protein